MLTPNDVLMTDDKVFELSRSLSIHNSIFYTIWEVSKIYFSYGVERACICFDKENYVLGIYLNPEFWNSISITTRHFVIMHECLHMFFKHGKRYNKNYSAQDNNKAQDIIINETITRSMNIDRNLIDNWQNYCFVDTCFPNLKNISYNNTYDYYLRLFSQNKKFDNNSISVSNNSSHSYAEPTTVDDHDKNNFDNEIIEDILNQFNHQAPEKDIEEFSDILEENIQKDSSKNDNTNNSSKDNSIAGTYSDPIVKFIKEVNRNRLKKQKKTWMDLVKSLTPSKKNVSYEKEEGWRTRKIQHSIIDTDVMIIGEVEREIITKKKYDVVVYIDISGSCGNLVEPFYNLLHTFPEDTFNLRTFTFNTAAKEFDWKTSRPLSNGGTSFTCIEKSVSTLTKENGKHPDVVFVFTDGDGNACSPEKPQNWVWILSKEKYTYIPNKSKKFLMNKFNINNKVR